ncbi:hypothetical protein ACWD6I_22085, partial [Streptomyces sp. NPDC002454]
MGASPGTSPDSDSTQGASGLSEGDHHRFRRAAHGSAIGQDAAGRLAARARLTSAPGRVRSMIRWVCRW